MQVMVFVKAIEDSERGSFPSARRTGTMAAMGRFAAKLMGCAAAFLAVSSAAVANPAALYPRMAPIDAYLMDRDEEIALARSAAPASISRDAEVLILERNGFQTAVEGENGFVCMVARSWTSAADADFWNPNVRVPMCFNAAAARSFMQHYLKITDLVLAGQTKSQIREAVIVATRKKQLPKMESGAMCYMLSKEGFGGDVVPHWPPHLMFFLPSIDPASWGANLPGSPVLGIQDPDQQITSFVVVVQHWSDGTDSASPSEDPDSADPHANH